jgi:hypothetical protein
VVEVKRASYREAVAWIAANDSPTDGADAAQIEGYVTTKLVADLFGVDDARVAKDVARARRVDS